jgi:type II secretory ATPase GspE/PulE/Tfp pilus assembly ATPase PilB-like protein/RNA polymerase subunit RPABC4/transcription elongation factor Spt4
MATRPRILGQLLVEDGHISAEVLDEVLGGDRKRGERIGEALVRTGRASSEDIARALSVQLGLPYAAPPLCPEREALQTVRPELVRAHMLLPLTVTPRTLQAAMADPLDLQAVDDLQFQTGKRVHAWVASPDAVLEGIESHYGGDLAELVEALPQELRSSGVDAECAELERATRRAPVVRLVDRILRSAIEDGASDIHVEETGQDVRIRLRIDGILRQTLDLPAASRRAVLSRLKVLADMDISVKRRAQDGRIPIEHGGRRLTLRVSTLPVNGGEKAVVRILDSDAAPRSLEGLGMAQEDLSTLRRLMARGEGVVLSAGPTGSGKSTTLFAALSELDRDVRNVVTLEDPVEYRLPGASQIQVDRRAGLGFPEALRAVLRQDPDVVMVGEIRDRETAEIAMTAAVTGHLVLSTIHTTDAPGAVTRLINMGVPPFLVAGGLAGVVAQRLVRRQCGRCRGRGCDACIDGYRGRTGVYQVLAISDALRDEVSRGGSSSEVRRLARETGMRGLDSDARRAVASGLTSPHEITRLIAAADGVSAACRHCDAPVPVDAMACPACGRQRRRRCRCGRILERGWRYCPWCVRPAAAA